MRRRATVVVFLLVVTAIFVQAGRAAAAAPSAPPGFFGIVPQAPPSAADYNQMRGTVGTIRLPIFWSEVEPARGEFDFAAVDREIGAAAARGIRVLPFIYGSPTWVEPSFARPPAGAARTSST